MEQKVKIEDVNTLNKKSIKIKKEKSEINDDKSISSIHKQVGKIINLIIKIIFFRRKKRKSNRSNGKIKVIALPLKMN